MGLGSTISKKPATGTQRPSAVARIRQFLVESWQELRKVLWPSREEALRFTFVVLGVIAVVAAFIFVVDLFLSQFSGPLFNIRP